MKVLHINCNYVGTTLHQKMIEELDKNSDIENEVFVPVYDKNVATIQINDNVKLVECFKKRDRFLFFYKQKKIYNSVEKNFDVKKFNILHAYTLFTDGYCAMKLYQKYNIPYVVAIRNTDVNIFFKYKFYLRKLGIEIMKNASAIIFLSKSYLNQVMDKYVPNKYKDEILKKVHIIPNGIDDFWHQNKFLEKDYSGCLRRLKEKKLNLIYAGGIDKNKNVELTVEAITKLIEEGWKVKFYVVGKIKDRKIFNKIKNYDFVNYVEPQSKEKLIDYYRSADIFVMPSHKETFGLVYAEAMSQGLPVIYTRGQGFDGQFEDGTIGYSVDANKYQFIERRILEIVNNYEIISKNCIKYDKNFNWIMICDKYKEMYFKIIK